MQIKFGAGIIEARGSIAGMTFSRNRSGAYARARVKPVNPNTELQDDVKSALAAMTTRWSQTVTNAQRIAWNLYAANVLMKNKLGESVNHSGFNHYIRSNAFLARYALTPVDAGPVVFELPAQDPTISITCSEATQQYELTFDDGQAWCSEDDAYLEVLLGAPQNPQRNFFQGPWRGVRFLAGDVGAPIASPQTLNALWGVAELQRLWVHCRIRRADGRLGEPFYANCFCAA